MGLRRRRQWHPTPVLLPGKSHGQRNLVRCSPWVARSWSWLRDFTFTFHFYALEKEMATQSSVLAWRIPGTGEPGGLPSMGSHRVGHDWLDLAAAAAANKEFKAAILTIISENVKNSLDGQNSRIEMTKDLQAILRQVTRNYSVWTIKRKRLKIWTETQGPMENISSSNICDVRVIEVTEGEKI